MSSHGFATERLALVGVNKYQRLFLQIVDHRRPRLLELAVRAGLRPLRALLRAQRPVAARTPMVPGPLAARKPYLPWKQFLLASGGVSFPSYASFQSIAERSLLKLLRHGGGKPAPTLARSWPRRDLNPHLSLRQGEYLIR